MALTRSFKELVQKRIASDPAFGDALLRALSVMDQVGSALEKISCAVMSGYARRKNKSRSGAAFELFERARAPVVDPWG
jgi:hypothetical protein